MFWSCSSFLHSHPFLQIVDAIICRPGGVVGSQIEKADGISSCYIVTTGAPAIITIAATDNVIGELVDTISF